MREAMTLVALLVSVAWDRDMHWWFTAFRLLHFFRTLILDALLLWLLLAAWLGFLARWLHYYHLLGAAVVMGLLAWTWGPNYDFFRATVVVGLLARTWWPYYDFLGAAIVMWLLARARGSDDDFFRAAVVVWLLAGARRLDYDFLGAAAVAVAAVMMVMVARLDFNDLLLAAASVC